jgi:hypothetical protein
MLTIFWTAYIPYVILLLSLIGSFMVHKMRRLSARSSFAPARGQRRRALDILANQPVVDHRITTSGDRCL